MTSEFCDTSHIWEATTAKQMNTIWVKIWANHSSFQKYKVYADIRGGSMGGGV